MNTTIATSLLEAKVSTIAGAPVELTVRGLQEFTFSTEVVNSDAAEKISAFFASHAKVEVVHDFECGTFVYVDAH
jgi:hypothetical protein